MNNTIYRYQQHPDCPLQISEWQGGALQDLGRHDGWGYLSVPADVTLGPFDQRLEWQVAPSAALQEFKAVSPVYQAINAEVAHAIRARYSLDQELQALRTNDAEYRQFVAQQIALGQGRKQELGFTPLDLASNTPNPSK